MKHVSTYSTSTVDKKAQDDEIKVRLCNYTDVYYQDRIDADNEYMEATASSNEYAKFKLLAGDTVITKDSEDWRDIAVPALIEKTASDFVCGYHLGNHQTRSKSGPHVHVLGRQIGSHEPANANRIIRRDSVRVT